MQIFGIGPLELLFILVIMILVLGPKGMVRAARELGKWIRKLVRSPIWSEIIDTSRKIREMPTKIIREAGIEREIDELRQSTQFPATYDVLNPEIGVALPNKSQNNRDIKRKRSISPSKSGKRKPRTKDERMI